MIRSVLPYLTLACLLAGCGYAPVAGGDSGPVATTSQGQPSPGASSSPGGAAADSFSEGANLPLVKLPDGLQLADIKIGDGAVAKKGDKLSMQYTGWLSNGKKFDSSRDRGQPFDFNLGGGQVIKGWDEGIPGMKVGGKRRLVIPGDLAYGPQGSPPTIPANATLVFVVEAISVSPAAATPSPSGAASPTPSSTP